MHQLKLKQLKSQDKVTITCHTVNQSGRFALKVGLVTGSNTPDHSNVACELNMYLSPKDSDELTINTIVNGQSRNVYKTSAADNDEGSDFRVTFRIRDEGLMDINLGDTNLHSMQLVHDVKKIRFLTVGGEIDKVIGLDFKYE